MKNHIPVDIVREWLTELYNVAEPKRYDGQKANMLGGIKRYLLAANTYREPSLWERIKNRITAIISRGKTISTDSGMKRDGQSFTANDSAS
jgi:hypothetical protein